ncbi:MAG TPA: ABC transporter ATP-binding protein [Bacillales bacterium]|nr:ABC transporter ATP-binding protein [Bacillales bacterium]
MLSCNLKKKLRDFTLAIDVELQNETTAIVGHSGSGKTTFLKLIAGLLAPDEGWIKAGEVTLFDERRKVNLLAEHRKTGYVFQNYALFPHLTVFDNVAYGLRRLDKAKQAKTVEDILTTLNLSGMQKRYPRELSGGEQQRVALARALVVRPRLLLLDEPISALDATTRRRVRRELKSTLQALPIPKILVTHDYEDALTLADRILVLDHGEVIQDGTAKELFANPRSSFIADFSGINRISGSLRAGDSTHARFVTEQDVSLLVSETNTAGHVQAIIYPWDVEVEKRPFQRDVNVFEAKITNLVPYGNRIRLDLDGALPLMAEVSADQAETLKLQENDLVFVKVDPTRIRLLS